tara:strand:- start:1864 stop:2070 length:207 start_codon:yes stop_codon:yes gene_type:complete
MSRLRVELAEGNADDQLVLLSWNSKIGYFNYMKNHMILAASGRMTEEVWSEDAYEEMCEDLDIEVAGE